MCFVSFQLSSMSILILSKPLIKQGVAENLGVSSLILALPCAEKAEIEYLQMSANLATADIPL